jgi:hypothetical protein
LLDAPTIGRGSVRPRGGGVGSQRSQIRLQSRLEYTKLRKNGQFLALNDLKNAEIAVFYLKVLIKIYSHNVF